MKKWLTAREYSKQTGMNYAEVLKQCKKGEFETKKSDGGRFYILYDENEKTVEIKKDKIDIYRKSKEELIQIVLNYEAKFAAVQGIVNTVI